MDTETMILLGPEASMTGRVCCRELIIGMGMLEKASGEH